LDRDWPASWCNSSLLRTLRQLDARLLGQLVTTYTASLPTATNLDEGLDQYCRCCPRLRGIGAPDLSTDWRAPESDFDVALASGSSHTSIWMEISVGLRPLYRESLLRSIVGSSICWAG
jgi:hypothetical protein